MVISTIAFGALGCGGGIWLTARRVITSLERRADRKLFRYVFDQTRSTDALSGYTELRRAQRPVIPMGLKSTEQTAATPPASEGQGTSP